MTVIPVPEWAWNTWGCRLAYTLLAVASNGYLEQVDKGFKLHNPIITADKLFGMAKSYEKRDPPLVGHDWEIIGNIANGLQIKTKATPTIGDLLKAVASAIQDPGAYKAAYDREVTPLLIVKSEYYEYIRSFGGFFSKESRDIAKAPPIYQALVLSGHVVTEFYLEKKTEKEDKKNTITSFHLIVAGTDYYPGLYTFYDVIRFTLSYLGRGEEPSTVTSLLQLLAASSIVGDSNVYQLLVDNGERDIFWTGKIQRRNKRVTVMAISQLPLAHLAVVLYNTLRGGFNKAFAIALRSLALASARVDGSCRLRLAAEMRGKEADVARKLRSMLEEYSQHLVLYAYTGDPLHAYAAARTARIAQQSREALKANVCTTYCKEGSCHGEMRPASDEFSILAEAAVRLMVDWR